MRAPALSCGQICEGRVESLAFGGEGIVRLQQLVVFVSRALPGETVRFRVSEVRKNYARGELEKIVAPGPHRVKAPCPIYRECGGCQIQELEYEEAVREKSRILEGLIRHGLRLDSVPMEPPLPSPNPYGYRNKIQLAVGVERTGKLLLGLYRPQTHLLVDMPACPVQEEAGNRLLPFIRQGLESLSLPPYDEKRHRGLLRRVLLRTNREGMAYVLLVLNGDHLPRWEMFLQALQKSGTPLAGLGLNVNREKTNTILGSKTRILWGEPYLEERIGTIRYRFGPETFFQVNSAILETLVDQVLEWGGAEPSDSVLDLYGGVGTFSIPWATRVKRVVGVEVNPASVRWARANAELNGVTNVEFLEGEVGEMIPRFEAGEFQLMFADPPRRGLGTKTAAEIVRLRPEKILYLSCNPPTLVRDLKEFLGQGWILRRVMAVDLFPQTAHLEALVLLEKHSFA